MHWSCVGHEEQKAYLARCLDGDALPRALLFAGPEGIGKRMVAEDVLSVMLPPGYAIDAVRLAPRRDEETGKVKDISIDAVREMKRWLSLRPLGAYKVVLVDDAERLGDEAANTMLKVLEEPPAYARFFLVTGTPQDILPTIASRCERLDFRPLDDDQMSVVLHTLKLDADDRALLQVVAAGRPGTALQLVHDKQLTTVARHIAALERALKSGVADRLIYAKEVADADAIGDIVAWWLAYVHAQLPKRPELAPAAHGLIDLAHAVAEPAFNRRLALEACLLALPILTKEQ